MSALDRVLVIGGSSGIGFEVARQVAARGADTVITGRDKTKLDAAAERLGDTATTAQLDAHDEAALDSFFSTLHAIPRSWKRRSGGTCRRISSTQ